MRLWLRRSVFALAVALGLGGCGETPSPPSAGTAPKSTPPATAASPAATAASPAAAAARPTAAARPPAAVFSAIPVLGDAASYEPLTADRWSVADDAGDLRYFLNTSDFDRLSGSRLGEYSLVRGRTFGDFTMKLQARSNEDKENDSPDYALVFGFQSPKDYVYLMMNGQAGLTELFAVVDGERITVAKAGAAGIPNTTAYHAVALSRAGTAVTVTLDGQPFLSATDARLGAPGRVGIGSFNDSAYFDDVQVEGVALVAPIAPIAPIVPTATAAPTAPAAPAAASEPGAERLPPSEKEKPEEAAKE